MLQITLNCYNRFKFCKPYDVWCILLNRQNCTDCNMHMTKPHILMPMCTHVHGSQGMKTLTGGKLSRTNHMAQSKFYIQVYSHGLLNQTLWY